MSDANGFGSGGISSVLTTGASVTGSVCDTSLDAVPAFTFALPDSLRRIRIVRFGRLAVR